MSSSNKTVTHGTSSQCWHQRTKQYFHDHDQVQDSCSLDLRGSCDDRELNKSVRPEWPTQ